MIPRPPLSTRTDTPFPYTTLFRSPALQGDRQGAQDRVGGNRPRGVPAACGHQHRLLLRIGAVAVGGLQRERRVVDQHPLGIALDPRLPVHDLHDRSEEHTSELQSLMRSSYVVSCLKKKRHNYTSNNITHI